MKTRNQLRKKRAMRVKAKIRGTTERPRLAVFRSHRNLLVQIIDDTKGETIVSKSMQGKNIAAGKKLGAEIAVAAKAKHITTVLFDRSGYRYHGVIEAIAQGAREGGLTI